MAEWLKAHAWKACVRETVPWVRIPLSPPRLAFAVVRSSSPAAVKYMFLHINSQILFFTHSLSAAKIRLAVVDQFVDEMK